MCIDIVKVKEQKADELLRNIFNLEEQKCLKDLHKSSFNSGKHIEMDSHV